MTLELKGKRLDLRKGAVYRARLRIDAPRFLATEGKIASALSDLGFAGVTVWKDVGDLPADWPADERATVAGGFASFTAFAEGAWGKYNDTVDRPEPLIAIWQHKAVPPLSKPSPEEAGSHTWARRILIAAWRDVFKEEGSRAALQAVQAVGCHETQYGRSWSGTAGEGSNNWGAVQCAPGWAGQCFPHGDTHADGKPYAANFRIYPSPEAGARDLIVQVCGTDRRRPVRQIIGTGAATRIARVMRWTGYFEDDADKYARTLVACARLIAGELGEPVFLSTQSILGALVSWGSVAGVVGYCYKRGYTHVL